MSKNFRFLICAALALCLLCGAAFAEEQPLAEYRVKERVFSPDTLCDICFSGFDGKVEEMWRRDGATAWHLKGVDGVPFCRTGPIYERAAGIQGEFNIFRVNDTGERYYWYNLNEWNTIPAESGFDAPKAKTTLAQGLNLLSRLDVTDVEPVYFSTMGAMEGATKCYKAVFRQTLNGLPVYWGQSVMVTIDDVEFNVAEGCGATVVYSSEDGLLKAEGSFCDFKPIGPKTGTVTQAEAAAKFAKRNLTASAPEQCYLLNLDGELATATLAWRVANTYLSAVTGEWLQLGN